jgi:hypothetical protein
MTKLGIQSIAFVILGAVLVAVLVLTHYLATNKTNLTRPDTEQLVKMILDEVSRDNGSHRFLIISKYVCRSCFEGALEKLGNDEGSKKITIILIGANDYETKMLNTTYRTLDFTSIDEGLYKKIEQIDAELAEGAFIGVRKNNFGTLSIYDGKSEYSDISARTSAVFDFILADTLDQIDQKIKKLNYLSTAGSDYPSILARNAVVLRYPKRAVSINLSTHSIDTINVGFLNVGFLRHMVDTTFEIATKKYFLLCERGVDDDKAFYDFSLYDFQGFPQNRRKLFRSNIYLNCAYDVVNNVLLFHPTLDDANKRVNIQFREVDFEEIFLEDYFVLLRHLEGSPRYNILKIEKNQKTSQPLPYQLGFDTGGGIFGYTYDSTGFQLYGYQIEKDLLKKVSETKFTLKTNFETKWMTKKFASRYYFLRIEKFRNWVILYMLDTISQKYLISKFNINSNFPILKEFYSGDDIGCRFHNTNLFVFEDLQAKKLRIIEDVELQ